MSLIDDIRKDPNLPILLLDGEKYKGIISFDDRPRHIGNRRARDMTIPMEFIDREILGKGEDDTFV